jgi:hypothetical protein
MNRERVKIVAVVASVSGVVLCAAAWWYYTWQQDEADGAEFSNAFVRDVSNGMVSGSESAPAAWPAVALGVAGGVLLVVALSAWVGSYVTSDP